MDFSQMNLYRAWLVKGKGYFVCKDSAVVRVTGGGGQIAEFFKGAGGGEGFCVVIIEA